MRKTTLHRIEVVQAQWIKWHDKYIKKKQFHLGGWALLYDSRYQEGADKMQTRWLAPYEVAQVFSKGVFQLTTINHVRFKLLVNGHRLRYITNQLQKRNSCSNSPSFLQLKDVDQVAILLPNTHAHQIIINISN